MPDTNYETSRAKFANLLQTWRAEMGLTRPAAAEALGVPHNTLEGWFAGRTCGHEKSFRKLMNYMAKEKRR